MNYTEIVLLGPTLSAKVDLYWFGSDNPITLISITGVDDFWLKSWLMNEVKLSLIHSFIRSFNHSSIYKLMTYAYDTMTTYNICPGYDVKLHPAVLHLVLSLCRSLTRSLAPLKYC